MRPVAQTQAVLAEERVEYKSIKDGGAIPALSQRKYFPGVPA